MEQKNNVYRVIPVDSDGVPVNGVIPIVCLDDELCDAYEMLEDEILSKHLSFNNTIKYC